MIVLVFVVFVSICSLNDSLLSMITPMSFSDTVSSSGDSFRLPLSSLTYRWSLGSSSCDLFPRDKTLHLSGWKCSCQVSDHLYLLFVWGVCSPVDLGVIRIHGCFRVIFQCVWEVVYVYDEEYRAQYWPLGDAVGYSWISILIGPRRFHMIPVIFQESDMWYLIKCFHEVHIDCINRTATVDYFGPFIQYI